MALGYRLADEEEAEDEAILRQFEFLSIEQPARRAPRVSLQRKRRLLIFVMAGAAGAAVIALIVLLSVRAALGRSESHWQCPSEAMPAQTPGTINFFVIGDWGRKGISEQKKVAKMMAAVADCMPPAFIISTGDNFYSHGLKSTSDRQIAQSFTDVYKYGQLQVPWYAVLGNHDYGDGIDPADNKCAANSLSACPEGCCYSAAWQQTGKLNDARWHLQNGAYAVPTGAQGLLDIFMIDTNPMIPRYKQEKWWNNAGGLWEQDPEKTKSQLRGYLAGSKAQWKLVTGHHPISSFGSHCAFSMANDCAQMAWLEPELNSAGVAAYLAGHDHDLQHNIKLSNPDDDDSNPVWPHHVISGAGSETRKNEKKNYKGKRGYSMEFMTDDSGFVALQANSTHLGMYFYGESRSGPMHTTVLKAPVRAQPVPRSGMQLPTQSVIQRVSTAPLPATAATAAAAATAATAATSATAATAATAAAAATAARSATAAVATAQPAPVAAAVQPQPAAAAAAAAAQPVPAAVVPVQPGVPAPAAVVMVQPAAAVAPVQPAQPAATTAAVAPQGAALPRPLGPQPPQPAQAAAATAAAVTTEAAARPAAAAAAAQPGVVAPTQPQPQAATAAQPQAAAAVPAATAAANAAGTLPPRTG